MLISCRKAGAIPAVAEAGTQTRQIRRYTATFAAAELFALDLHSKCQSEPHFA